MWAANKSDITFLVAIDVALRQLAAGCEGRRKSKINCQIALSSKRMAADVHFYFRTLRTTTDNLYDFSFCTLHIFSSGRQLYIFDR